MHATKITKHYGVNGGNRFARVECACGALTDVRVRDGQDGSEETRAGQIKAAAERALIHRPGTPPIHKTCGQPMSAGTYPYDCGRRDSHPGAVVWHDETCRMFQVDLPSERKATAYAIEWR